MTQPLSVRLSQATIRRLGARALRVPLPPRAYYGAYPDEIDQWIDLNEQETAEAYAAWARGQAAVQG
jgi:hypothetical protein